MYFTFSALDHEWRARILSISVDPACDPENVTEAQPFVDKAVITAVSGPTYNDLAQVPEKDMAAAQELLEQNLIWPIRDTLIYWLHSTQEFISTWGGTT